MNQLAVVVVAGGSGNRFGGFKQLEELDGKPLLAHCLQTLQQLSIFQQCVVVLAEDLVNDSRWSKIESQLSFPSLKVTKGGKTRKDSVQNGLDCLRPETEIVAVHDAARPFIPVQAFQQCIKNLIDNSMLSGCIIASPCRDTLKRVSLPSKDEIAATIPRDEFIRAETPQVCRYQDFIRAMELTRGKKITDESMVLEMAGMKTGVVLHEGFNIKVTRPQDLELAEAYIQHQKKSANV